MTNQIVMIAHRTQIVIRNPIVLAKIRAIERTERRLALKVTRLLAALRVPLGWYLSLSSAVLSPLPQSLWSSRSSCTRDALLHLLLLLLLRNTIRCKESSEAVS